MEKEGIYAVLDASYLLANPEHEPHQIKSREDFYKMLKY